MMASGATPQPAPAWRVLFDGTSLKDWKGYKTDAVPEGWKIGADVRFEGVFVGYFLKTLGYEAFQKNRSAPLLIGKIRHTGRGRPVAGGAAGGPRVDWTDPWFLGSVGLVVAAGVWFWLRRPKTKPLGAPIDDSKVESWLASGDPVIPDETKPPTTGGTGGSPLGIS